MCSFDRFDNELPSSSGVVSEIEPFAPLGEPFVIIPEVGGGEGGGESGEEGEGDNAVEGAGGDPKNETDEYGGPSLALHQLPFYVDYLDP